MPTKTLTKWMVGYFVKVLFMRISTLTSLFGLKGRLPFELWQSSVMQTKTLTKWRLAYFVKVLFTRTSTLTKFVWVAGSVSLRTLAK